MNTIVALETAHAKESKIDSGGRTDHQHSQGLKAMLMNNFIDNVKSYFIETKSKLLKYRYYFIENCDQNKTWLDKNK